MNLNHFTTSTKTLTKSPVKSDSTLSYNERLTNVTTRSGMPPHNADIEASILGGILLDPLAMDAIHHRVEVKMFFVSKHRIVYKAIKTLYDKEQPTDLLLVSAHLQDNNELEVIGGISFLAHLIDVTPSAVNIDKYVNVLVEKYLSRQIGEIGYDCTELCNDNTYSSTEKIALLERKLAELQSTTNDNETFSNEDVAIKAYEDLSKDIALFPTGYSAIDSRIVGLEAGTLTVLAGRPSMGKSAFALALALQFLILHKKRVIFFSKEMSKEQLEYRLWSAISVHPHFADLGFSRLEARRIRQHFVKSPELSVDELTNLTQILMTACKFDFFINEKRDITPSEIRNESRRLQSSSTNGLSLIIIDYLQLFETEGSTASEVANSFARHTRYFFRLAAEMNCPILLLSQLNRACESRNDKRPMSSDLAQSGAIEAIVDQIFSCYRESYYNKNSPNNDLEIGILKARHGGLGTAKLGFDRDTQAIFNLTNNIYYDPD